MSCIWIFHRHCPFIFPLSTLHWYHFHLFLLLIPTVCVGGQVKTATYLGSKRGWEGFVRWLVDFNRFHKNFHLYLVCRVIGFPYQNFHRHISTTGFLSQHLSMVRCWVRGQRAARQWRGLLKQLLLSWALCRKPTSGLLLPASQCDWCLSFVTVANKLPQSNLWLVVKWTIDLKILSSKYSV